MRGVIAGLVLWSAASWAGEVQLELAPSFKKSTWSGDAGGGVGLRVGYRFLHAVTLDALIAEELFSVDLRDNTSLTLGVTGALPLGRLRPTLRSFFVHQHEQGLVSTAKSPWTVVLGIGDGIRHRAGFGFTLGLEYGLERPARWVELFFTAGVTATFFPDTELGPFAYLGGSVGLGLSFDTEGKKP